MNNIKVVIGIDTETDIGSWTPWYEGLVNGTPIVLDLFRKHQVTGTFYFTGDAARKNPGTVQAVKAAGHEIGCHTLFHETIGDALFDIPGMMPILPEEVPLRLKLATEWVEEVAGVRPLSFRCPRLFGSTAVVNALDALGYRTDASYPMYFYRERLTPYHPAADDWTKEGSLSLVELPNFADMAMESQDKFGRDRDQWPLFRTAGADELMRHIDSYVEFCTRRKVEPFLCFYFHPWEFWPMRQGLIHYGEGSVLPDPFLIENCGPYAVAQFDLLLSRLKAAGAVFHQAKDITA